MLGLRRCAESAFVALAVANSAHAQSNFAAVQKAAENGDYAAAERLAETIVAPRDRAQALVWLHYAARDYAGALDLAERGLEASGEDLWLEERAAAAAISLADAERAPRATERLARTLASSRPADADRAKWDATLLEYRTRAKELSRVADESAGALLRSRGVAVAILALVLAAFARLALRRGAQP